MDSAYGPDDRFDGQDTGMCSPDEWWEAFAAYDPELEIALASLLTRRVSRVQVLEKLADVYVAGYHPRLDRRVVAAKLVRAKATRADLHDPLPDLYDPYAHLRLDPHEQLTHLLPAVVVADTRRALDKYISALERVQRRAKRHRRLSLDTAISDFTDYLDARGAHRHEAVSFLIEAASGVVSSPAAQRVRAYRVRQTREATIGQPKSRRKSRGSG
jgi:hypothetical protein